MSTTPKHHGISLGRRFHLRRRWPSTRRHEKPRCASFALDRPRHPSAAVRMWPETPCRPNYCVWSEKDTRPQ